MTDVVAKIENEDEVMKSEHYQSLIEAGCTEKVAGALDAIFVEGLVQYSELDERAIEALKELEEDGAIAVLKQFKDSNLQHVQNKSAFLCGVMKIYRQRLKAEKDGRTNLSQKVGPNEDDIQALLDRTKYSLDVTTGQRRYGGPPPTEVYDGEEPGPGCQVFIGRIPRDVFEDEIIPLLEKAGTIWDFRLMMEPLSGQNRGYGFASFVQRDMAVESVKLLDNYEIKPKKFLGVCLSQSNCRLFIGSIPKNKTKDEIFEEFQSLSPCLKDVIVYHQTEDKSKNRGFCFLEYTDHKSASQARRKLGSGKTKVWNNLVSVDWADPIDNPSDEVMSKVKVLYLKNLATKASEEVIQTTFSSYGEIERVKKIKDYAFVHFKDREQALKAMQELNGLNLEGEPIEISLAKPVDKKKKERQMERKMNQHMGIPGQFNQRGQRGRGPRGGHMGPMGFPPMPYNSGGFVDDYYDYMGFGSGFGGGYDDPYFGGMGMGGPGFRGRGNMMMRGYRGRNYGGFLST
ncbi:heterogeneous nuclear ribonucleoprotein R-like isoform X2 [Styela clava]|uniref:heterogeneous nuclear ribonucleoprotein R-like isoform X2 n=1 Tax=Styela clava TaxID=7725 RepID=UPI0019398F10|nr:heterogeneous nuclear ribonucleoprotein R-like isoform X2 [Styela clava]